MHKFVQPTQDTYINNDSDDVMLNFGRNEILKIEAISNIVKTYTNLTIPLSMSVQNVNIINFNGAITGSIIGHGTIISGSGTINGCGMDTPYTASC